MKRNFPSDLRPAPHSGTCVRRLSPITGTTIAVHRKPQGSHLAAVKQANCLQRKLYSSSDHRGKSNQGFSCKLVTVSGRPTGMARIGSAGIVDDPLTVYPGLFSLDPS